MLPPQAGKLQRVEGAPPGSERHFADLIAQKQLLQQLESEYALKIQKLKEAQALRNKGVSSDPAAGQRPRASAPLDPPSRPADASSPVPLPQPSLHDLTQDKLTLDSEDIPEADDHESESAAAAAIGSRRHSFRQVSSFTKPNLEQLSSTPAKDSGAAKPTKTSGGTASPAEVFAGLDVDALRRRYKQQLQLGELLLLELQSAGGHVDDVPAAQVAASNTQDVFQASTSCCGGM